MSVCTGVRADAKDVQPVPADLRRAGTRDPAGDDPVPGLQLPPDVFPARQLHAAKAHDLCRVAAGLPAGTLADASHARRTAADRRFPSADPHSTGAPEAAAITAFKG